MDWLAAIGGERRLRRILALMLSFASIAEDAAGRSKHVRWLLLWILRRAEVILEDFVIDVTGQVPVVDDIAAQGNEQEDAIRLAERFRALAALLAAILTWACLLDNRTERRGLLSRRVPTTRGLAVDGWDRIAHDTS